MITLYKSNENCTGCLFSFQLGKGKGDKTSSLFISSVKQAGWEKNDRGEFQGIFKANAKNPEKSVGIKCNLTEIGDFVDAFEQYLEHHPDHTLEMHRQNDVNNARVTLSRYQNGKKKGYKFSIEKDGVRFIGGITRAEAVTLREMFKWCILTILAEMNENFNNYKPNQQAEPRAVEEKLYENIPKEDDDVVL